MEDVGGNSRTLGISVDICHNGELKSCKASALVTRAGHSITLWIYIFLKDFHKSSVFVVLLN